MRHFALAALLSLNAFILSGCVSAWMTTSTGKPHNFEFTNETSRTEVIAALGQPKDKITTINRAPPLIFRGAKVSSIAYAELFAYRGKINAPDEGGGQIMISSVTLGISELIAIPLTAVDIAVRSFGNHPILVYFDNTDHVVSLWVDPPQTAYQQGQTRAN